MTLTAFIAYCSPAGSTRMVAEMIKEAFLDQSITVHSFDIGKDGAPDSFIEKLTNAGDQALLFMGSPVYRDVAIPPVTGFLERLPQSLGAFAVPFITWGQACSGIALWQLGQILVSKGCRLAAGAKMLGVHSMMWTSDHPAGMGHPDQNARDLIRKSVQELIKAHQMGGLSVLAPEVLDYQPEELSKTMKPKINEPLMVIPRSVKTDICTQCGICAESCPVSAIVLNPYPEFLPHCFGCMTCVRECPENAIEPAVPLSKIQDMIRQRISTINETPGNQVFMP